MFAYRRGVMVARFDRKGNLRASIRGASNGGSPRFLYLGVNVINHLATLLGDVVQNKNHVRPNNVIIFIPTKLYQDKHLRNILTKLKDK